MGNIYQDSIKRMGRKILKENPDRFTTDFDKNKEILSQIGYAFYSKRQRNRTAGYITRLLNPHFGVPIKVVKDQEESWKIIARRRDRQEKMRKRKKRKRRPRSALV